MRLWQRHSSENVVTAQKSSQGMKVIFFLEVAFQGIYF